MINTEKAMEEIEYLHRRYKQDDDMKFHDLEIINLIDSLLKMINDLNKRLTSLENDCDKADISHA